MTGFRRRASDFCLSLPFAMFIFLAAATVVMLQKEVVGVLVFVGILSLLLVLCDDVTVTTLPFLLLCMFVLKCYDSFNTFIVFAPWAVIPIGALVYHLIANKNRFRIGKSFWGIVTVAIAVTMGGWFSLPFSDYFSGTSLFYVGGLGIGMVGAYLLLKREFVPSDRYSIVERLLAIFYIAGWFGVFMLASHCIIAYEDLINPGVRMQIQWSNNLSTMMMFFMPIPFYYALTKSRWHYLVGLLFYLTIAFTGSRGGLLMGGVEFVICILFVSYHDKVLRFISIGTVVSAVAILFIFKEPILVYFKVGGENHGLISPNEKRFDLMKLALKDFANNPVFGQGLGYTGNLDAYSPVKGAANWYHMMVFQIIGSLGTVGILGYGYQFYTRVKLIFQKPTLRMMALGLSYAGIFLMSQINPGEFCPIPYELLAVLLFIFLELPRKELEGDKKNAFTSIKKAFCKKDSLA